MSKTKCHVMIVDDDESVRGSLSKLLTSEGYLVTLAANGAEAVEIYSEQPAQIDLLLVDLNMPQKNGWATLDRLFEVNCSLPVFILTGLPHQHELAEASGVNALVEKPIDVPRLLQLIHRQLAEPLRPCLAPTSHRTSPFYYLRAARDESRNQWEEPSIVSYDHWGLNE